MTALPKLAPSRMTVEEFLDWPGDRSGRGFELVDGEPRAMAPASGTHGRIQATIARLLGNHLAGTGCSAVIRGCSARPSTSVAAELLRRQPDGSWPATAMRIGGKDRLSLGSPDFSCPLMAVYEGTRFYRPGED